MHRTNVNFFWRLVKYLSTINHLSINEKIGGKGKRSEESLLLTWCRRPRLKINPAFFNLCASQVSVCEDRRQRPETGTSEEKKKRSEKMTGLT